MSGGNSSPTVDAMDAEAAFDQHVVKTWGWTKFASMHSATSAADYARGFKDGWLANRQADASADALKALRTAAVLLLNHVEGCAQNHYGHDFAEHGEPGWIADCRAQIEAASPTSPSVSA